MSFRVWKGKSAPTPRPAMAPAAEASLPANLVDAGAGRLAVLALLTASVTIREGRSLHPPVPAPGGPDSPSGS
jgi:hypothetical protein